MDQVAVVGDSSPNRFEDDDKNEQSDRGSPEIFVQERTELDRLEKHCCIKCNKVGKMLVCTEIGRPVAIHEDCHIPKANYDDSRNFYCPYCSYKRAVDQVQRFRKKAMSAKEELSKFLKVKRRKLSLPLFKVKTYFIMQHVDQNMAAATEKCDLEAKENKGTQVRNLEETDVRKEHKKIESLEKTKKAAGESTIGDAFESNAGENVENKNNESHNVNNVNVSEGSEDGKQNANPSKSKTNVRKNLSHKKKERNVFPSQRERKRLMWTQEIDVDT